MNFADFLKTIGVQAEAEVVRDVVKRTVGDSNASPSQLINALVVTLGPKGSAVIADGAGAAEAGKAAKVVSFLVEQGTIRIDGRRVCITAKFSELS